MNRIDAKFKLLKQEGKSALIAYICAGDPDLQTTFALVLELERNGADIIELGVPFSDPIADGPTIQRAAQRALERNTTLAQIFALVKKIRTRSQIPLALMTYMNPVYQYGLDKVARASAAVGIDGFIIPDLPLEAGAEVCLALRKKDIDLIFLVTPLTDKKRFAHIQSRSSGFIYYVSVTGVTGARSKMGAYIEPQAKEFQNMTALPLVIGFGVSTPQQVKKLSQIFAGVVVGSAIVNIIESNLSQKDLVAQVGRFVRNLKSS